jgi:phosphate transport system protein
MEPTEGHTVKRYDAELTHLRGRVLEMGGLVIDQIQRAIKALKREDLDGAADVIDRDHLVDDFDVDAEKKVVDLIARRQPVANDLRMVIATSKAVANLERIGDEAVKIARLVLSIYGHDESPPNKRMLRDIKVMAGLAVSMLRGSLDAFDRLDMNKAVEILQEDEEMDEEFQSAMRRLATYVMEDSRTLGHSINATLVIKALERIGDHAKAIAETTIYQVKGKDVRHLSPAKVAQEAQGDHPII